MVFLLGLCGETSAWMIDAVKSSLRRCGMLDVETGAYRQKT